MEKMSEGTEGRAKSAGRERERERTCDRVPGLDEGLCVKKKKRKGGRRGILRPKSWR